MDQQAERLETVGRWHRVPRPVHARTPGAQRRGRGFRLHVIGSHANYYAEAGASYQAAAHARCRMRQLRSIFRRHRSMPASRKRRHKRRAPSQSSKQSGRAARTAKSRGDEARPKRAYSVRNSPIHGRGVFATRAIRKGADIIEYRGRRISMDEADDLPDSDPDNPFHTFLFELNDGRVIDAGRAGNSARWINHSCRPNCEPYEDDEGRVYIAAKRAIQPGEELSYDYKLNVPGRRSARMLADYACHCGAPRCRGTMVGPPPKAAATRGGRSPRRPPR